MEELNPTLSLLTLTVITLSLGNVICQYEDCGRPFVCGSPTPIEFRYPFWGEERHDYCGRPGFGLTCINNIARLNISSASYRVLWIDNSTQTLRIARDDLSNTLCPSIFVNTDLDFSLFDFSYGYRDQNITLLYDCGNSRTTPDAPPVDNRFSCPVDGSTTLTWSYYLTRELIGVWRNVTEACDRNITVPVNGDAAVTLATLGVDSVSVLQRALAHGFWIRWRTDNDRCSDCSGSGGLCGHSLSSGSFACYCEDGSTRDWRCNGNGNGSTSGIRIGLPIGGAVLAVGIGVGWLVFHHRQRRKKRVERLGSNFNRSALSFTTTSNSDFSWCSTYNGAQVFDYTELEKATNNFDPSRILGDGGFGSVYYGTLSDGSVVAVKRLYENNFKRVEQFTNEVKILTGLRHKNLVSLYGSTSHLSRRLLLVYEFVPNGTVADHLHGARRAALPWPVRLDIAVETAEALDYLHKSEIIHRDVKTTNLLLDMGFHVKVADFGLSRLFPTDVTHVSTAPQGTPGYVDPEYHQCYQLTEKSDVYSFGVVLVELMSSLVAVDTSRHRHDVNLASMAVNKIQKGAVEELVDPGLGFGTDGGVRRAVMGVAELAFRCLQCEREMRPAMWEVVAGLKRIREEGLGGSHAVEVVDLRADDGGGPLREAVETPSLSPPDSGSAQMSY